MKRRCSAVRSSRTAKWHQSFAAASVREPGVARFDVVQQADDPARFVLVEAYRTPAAHAAHRETPHYAAWRDAVAPLMAEPRTAVQFAAVFPAGAAW